MVLYQFKIIQHLFVQSSTMKPSTTNLWRKRISNVTAHSTALYKVVTDAYYQMPMHKFVGHLIILSCEFLPISFKNSWISQAAWVKHITCLLINLRWSITIVDWLSFPVIQGERWVFLTLYEEIFLPMWSNILLLKNFSEWSGLWKEW